MATDVFIPGDDLEQASKSLGIIQDHIDIGTGTFDFDLAFGTFKGSGGDIRNAAGDFEKHWKDGRTQLKDQIDQIKKALDNVIDQFGKMDTDAGNQLDAGNGGGS